MPPSPLPRIVLGCGNFGGVGSAPELFGQGQSSDEAFALMDAAWAAGIRHFDTADSYGGGRSETVIGRWIASRGVRPGLTTKTFNPMSAGADRGLAPRRIASQLRASLDRLGTGSVELYLAHDFDAGVPLADTFAAFEAAVADGTVLRYGVSNFDRAQLRAALAAGRPSAIQNGCSLLTPEDDGLLALCAEHQVAYQAFGPLEGGWLTGKYRRGEPFPAGSRMTQRPEPYRRLCSDPTFDGLERLGAAAAARGLTMAGLALAWALGDPRITQIVIGPGRPAHLAPVTEALAHPLTGGERAEIERMVR